MEPVKFGKYSLLNRIAAGGMAEIFLGSYIDIEGNTKYIAIKKLLPNLSEDPDFIQMFLDEARIAALLFHPNICQILDVGAVDKQYFIAMEYLYGKDLRQIMKKIASFSTIIPMSLVIRIISDLCAGLHHAHLKVDNKGNPLKIIHRDVSPPNIIITYDGIAKIIDFGIAKAETKIYQTRVGVLKGKYSYMSPEQVTGMDLDYRSDIFSVGIILYELTTGRRLFKLDTDILILQAISEGNVPPPSSVIPNFPQELEEIILKTLNRDREKRFQTCKELQNALETFAVKNSLISTPQELSDFLRKIFSDEADQFQAAFQPHKTEDEKIVSFLPQNHFQNQIQNIIQDKTIQEQNQNSNQFNSMSANQVSAQSSWINRIYPIQFLIDFVQKSPLLFFSLIAILFFLLVLLILSTVLFSDEQTPPKRPVVSKHINKNKIIKENAKNIINNKIRIASTPLWALIYIDGKLYPNVTPSDIEDIDLTIPHTIYVEIPGAPPQVKIFSYDNNNELNFTFNGVSKPGIIKFISNQSDINIKLNKRDIKLDAIPVEAEKDHDLIIYYKGQKIKGYIINLHSGEEFYINIAKLLSKKIQR